MDQATRLREMVRTNQNNEIKNARVITVTSGKGGVGKTSMSVNLAIQISKMGKKVVILDADFGLANVEVMLGIRPQYTLLDLIYNSKSIDEIITRGPNNIGFISGGSGISELASLDNGSIKLLISELAKLDDMYDVMIIDTGAGITDSVMEFVMISPEVLLVITPEPTSITDAYSLLKVLRRRTDFNPLYKSINVISNRVDSKAEGLEIYEKINTVSAKFLNTKLNYFGSVTYDKNVSSAVIVQKPVVVAFPNSMAAKDISALASKLMNDEKMDYKKHDGIAKVFFDFIKSKKKPKT